MNHNPPAYPHRVNPLSGGGVASVSSKMIQSVISEMKLHRTSD